MCCRIDFRCFCSHKWQNKENMKSGFHFFNLAVLGRKSFTCHLKRTEFKKERINVENNLNSAALLLHPIQTSIQVFTHFTCHQNSTNKKELPYLNVNSLVISQKWRNFTNFLVSLASGRRQKAHVGSLQKSRYYFNNTHITKYTITLFFIRTSKFWVEAGCW